MFLFRSQFSLQKMRIPPGLARLPLWKRDITKYPLFYKGDPQNRVFLPLFWMKVIPPEEKVPLNYVHFMVHPQMSKGDIKSYLEKIYEVPVLSVRTELRRRDVRANQFRNRKITDQKITVWREEDKYAYVQLKSGTFQYPNFFDKGETVNMKDRILFEKDSKKQSRRVSQKSPGYGLPPWFTVR